MLPLLSSFVFLRHRHGGDSYRASPQRSLQFACASRSCVRHVKGQRETYCIALEYDTDLELTGGRGKGNSHKEKAYELPDRNIIAGSVVPAKIPAKETRRIKLRYRNG